MTPPERLDIVALLFIRRVKPRPRSDGEHTFSFRLVRSECDGDKVRQRTGLNLGRHFPVDRGDWPALYQRIENILTGQVSLAPEYTGPLEAMAQNIAAQLLAKQRVGTTVLPVQEPSEHQAPLEPDRQMVDIHSLRLVHPRSVGVEQVGLWAMDPLGLRSLLTELGLGPSLAAAAMGSIIGRMARPGSERATRRWLSERSALGDLLGTDFTTLGSMRLVRASDALMAHREAIERHLFDRVADLFERRPTITLYDLTYTYFEGGASRQPKARRGHSQEPRRDCPLLTLALVLDSSGFVRRSRVFAGHVCAHRTLPEMLEALETPPGALAVMDRGIATEERIQWRREQGVRYLVVSRERTRRFDAEAAVHIETASRQSVHRHKTLSEEGQEARLTCDSESRAARERGIAEPLAERFEHRLNALAEGLTKPRTRKHVGSVWQRIGRIQEQSHGISQHDDIVLDTDPTGHRATAVRFTRRALPGSLMTHPGGDCLRSNETSWDEATRWRTDCLLTDVEAALCSLTSEWGLRPIDHHQPLRTEGHLFISVLAYQLVQVIRMRLRPAGEQASWPTLRGILEGHHRTTVICRRADGRTWPVRRATEAEPPQQVLYDALGIHPTAGGMSNTLVTFGGLNLLHDSLSRLTWCDIRLIFTFVTS